MICKLVTGVIQCFCFSERPMKGRDILDSQKGRGILEKGWVDLGKGGRYDPPYQLCSQPLPKILGPPLILACPPPTQNLIFCSGSPQLFWPEIFRSPPKIRGAATVQLFLGPGTNQKVFNHRIHQYVDFHALERHGGAILEENQNRNLVKKRSLFRNG